MRSGAARCLLLALLPGCAHEGTGAEVSPRIELHLGAQEIELGQGFALTIVRVHPREMIPAPFEESALAPLALRPLEVRRRSRGAASVETRRYLAHAFEVGELRLGPLELAVPGLDGVARVVATSVPARLRVRSAFPPGTEPGPAEMPGGLLHAPARAPWGAAFGALLALLAAATWFVGRARGRRAPRAPQGPTAFEDARARAHKRLAALDADGPRTRAEDECFHGELDALLRAFLGDGFGLPASQRTREELAADERWAMLVGPGRRASLDVLLARCDALRFAPSRSTQGERAEALARAADFLAPHPERRPDA